MEQDLPGAVVQEQEEASAEGEEAVVGWEGCALELDPAGVVSALIVGLHFLIKLGLPAIT